MKNNELPSNLSLAERLRHSILKEIHPDKWRMMGDAKYDVNVAATQIVNEMVSLLSRPDDYSSLPLAMPVWVKNAKGEAVFVKVRLGDLGRMSLRVRERRILKILGELERFIVEVREVGFGERGRGRNRFDLGRNLAGSGEYGAIDLDFEEVVETERQTWSRVLGREIKIPPLPDFVTKEVGEKLLRLGPKFRHIPRLDIGTPNELRGLGVEMFLDNIEDRYPGCRRYGGLAEHERANPLIGRILEEWFWELVLEERIDFPVLPGRWVAVETFPKPERGGFYEENLLGRGLGFEDRFGNYWKEPNKAIMDYKWEMLAMLGLPLNLEVRMPEALEWNLLALREGWGATDSFEWTNTIVKIGNMPSRIIVGDRDQGGAAYAGRMAEDKSSPFVGWRVMVLI